ncbi:simple sugar transport system permease protein [Propionispira arboris]|uniref:Simple sugar transport system permease protein n=1 Tax=Propionispira arboris TaxID=84035 RepID=A0A1H6TX36_9FIRM|nr:galactofuranose ABC transporter, permease protein YjfF [Propionispira arboris]SEI80312.1 simple sugar transport system permease protein [Propionispira arboris]
MNSKLRTLTNEAISSQYFSFFVTVILFLVLYGVGIMTYKGFMRPQVFFNLFIDNSALIIVTIGITFTLLTGGIDLSVGAIVALSCMILASLLQNTGVSVPVAVVAVLVLGIFIGGVQGYLITAFNMQPFIVTLAGMFFCRGLTAVISRETISITNDFYVSIASERIGIFGLGFISIGAVVALCALVVAAVVLKYTKFGRTIFALGGNEVSASLMGLPVFKTKIMVYVISGFCAALGGVVYSWIMLSGYTLHGLGMEMDAIASSVIGGTLLTGGVGFIPGTLFGVLIQGVILTFITFQGTLSAWWTKIVVGALLCIFIIMQALITERKSKLSSKSSIEAAKQ